MTILAGVIIMLIQDWTLGMVILGPAIPVIVTCVIFEQRYARVARLAQDQVGDLTTVVEESVLGIRIIKGFGRHRTQARAFRDLSRTLRGTELHKAQLLATIWGVIVTLPELALGATLVLGTIQVADGDLSAGTLVAFLSTALALRWPVESIGFLLAMSQEAATATERYFEVMDESPEAERPMRGAGNGATSPHEPAPDHDGIRFTKVTFRYPDAPPDSPPTLDSVNLHIRPGESMALVGATGTGKTTLTALVPRLHEVTSGQITLDGKDITAMPRDSLRALVAVAFEEPTLFSATVGENVLMGAGEAAGKPELERALAVAQADFVGTLPRARTPRWANRASASPAANANASPWQGRWWAHPASWSWTIRSPHWTSTPRGGSRGRPASSPRRHHGVDRGPPPVHGPPGRPRGPPLGRPHHRGGHPPGTPADERRVRTPDVRRRPPGDER